MNENEYILILNGPNLNLLGRRNTAVYGTETMESVLVNIQRAYPDLHLQYRQSNHEGELIDWLQRVADDNDNDNHNHNDNQVIGIVLNAGGYTHTSVALRDAVEYVREQGVPVVEVHISDISKREDFRKVSLLTDVCSKTIMGHGVAGYQEAVEWLSTNYSDKKEK